MKKIIISLAILFPSLLWAQSNNTTVSTLFEQLKKEPQLLNIFLTQMPKGGELHYHWDGSDYPEDMVYDIRNDDFCFNYSLVGVESNKNCLPQNLLNQVGTKPGLYQAAVNDWSLTDKDENLVNTNKHFFQFFLGTEPITSKYSGQILADEMQRAALEKEDYVELTYILDVPQMLDVGFQLPFDPNFANMEKALQTSKVESIINDIADSTTQYQQQARQLMQCDTKQAELACGVNIRFIFGALRSFSPNVVFTQLYIAFNAANRNPSIVAVDLVGSESDYNSIHDYDLHMQMVRYLHRQFPHVHVRLHAGELSLADAPPEAMLDHVDKAINIAGAERIGHGVDIAGETNQIAVLKEMAKKHIAVEQLLTSNEKLLGVVGNDQPLPIYLHYHVPVVLSTDDEGILRTNLTTEYLKAITRYNLTYAEVKTMVRNVPTYSFLPGASLWQNPDNFIPVLVCQHDIVGSTKPSAHCAAFLANSLKAKQQWQLEHELTEFEATITAKMQG